MSEFGGTEVDYYDLWETLLDMGILEVNESRVDKEFTVRLSYSAANEIIKLIKENKERNEKMTNAEWMVKNGRKASDFNVVVAEENCRPCWTITVDGHEVYRREARLFSAFDVFAEWLDREHEEKPILDKAEREFLSNLAKTGMKDVTKVNDCNYNEYLFYHAHDGAHTLPGFEEGTMYKGMQANKMYTLDELGL